MNIKFWMAGFLVILKVYAVIASPFNMAINQKVLDNKILDLTGRPESRNLGLSTLCQMEIVHFLWIT